MEITDQGDASSGEGTTGMHDEQAVTPDPAVEPEPESFRVRVKDIISGRVAIGAVFRELTQAEIAERNILCPVIPGCTLLGVYIDEDGCCWCVYNCGEFILFQRCGT